MGGIIVALLAVIIVLVGVVFIIHPFGDNDGYDAVPHIWQRVGGAVALFVAAIMLFFTCTVQVSTKNVGVVTAFGQTVTSLSNGIHVIAPWDSVTEMDAAIQTDSHVKGSSNDCITARIDYQATACVDVSIRWRIKESQATELFKNYRDFSSVRDSLVTRELKAAVNTAFEGYDPLNIDPNTGKTLSTPLSDLETQVAKTMNDKIGTQIEVDGIIIPVVHFDTNIQDKINNLQGQVGKTLVALEAIKTAEDQAKANAALSKSVSNDPNVLVNKCLNALEEAINAKYPLPAGFNCFGGSGVTITASK